MPRWTDLFIVAFLAVQLALPLPGFFRHKFEHAGIFSWNMYSFMHKCDAQYRLDTPNGETLWPDEMKFFNREHGTATVFFAANLPKFHRWMCETFRQEGKLGILKGAVFCAADRGQPREMTDPTVDLCTAENYGVRKLQGG